MRRSSRRVLITVSITAPIVAFCAGGSAVMAAGSGSPAMVVAALVAFVAMVVQVAMVVGYALSVPVEDGRR